MAKTKRKIPKPSTRLPRLPPNKNHGDKKKYNRKKTDEPAPEHEDLCTEIGFEDCYDRDEEEQ